MTDTARSVMVRDFEWIREDASAGEAIARILEGKTRGTGYKTVSLMVVNDMRELVGVVTLFDILYHLRPTCLNFGVDGSHISWEGILEPAIRDLRTRSIKGIMSEGLVTAEPDEHCMVLIDRMVKNKYRRLPVVENGKLVGVVYVTDIFHHLFGRTL